MNTMESLDLVEQLCAPHGNAPAAPAVLVLAHPDDETVGAGARLTRWRSASFIYLTDGAPRDMRDARAVGLVSREQYAQARWDELRLVMAAAGIAPERVCSLGLVDQEAALQLVALTRTLESFLARFWPVAVVTHAYEGGHPDHDAAAFAAHAACRLLHHGGRARPAVVEMALYHNGPVPTWGEFLPDSSTQVHTYALSEQERRCKQLLLDCYATQKNTLRPFPTYVERFRLAPQYRFSRPPHAGQLYYEHFNLGLTAARWCELAAAALDELQLREPL